MLVHWLVWFPTNFSLWFVSASALVDHKLQAVKSALNVN